MIPFSRTHPELCWGLLRLAQESRYCPSPRNSMFSNLLLVAGHLPGWSIYTMESGKSFKSGPLSYRELIIKCLPAISDQYFLFLDYNKVLGYLNPFVSLLHNDIFSCHAFFFFFFFVFLSIFRAAPAACGGSQARGLMGAVASSVRQSCSNSKSKPHLRPTPQLTAVLDP